MRVRNREPAPGVHDVVAEKFLLVSRWLYYILINRRQTNTYTNSASAHGSGENVIFYTSASVYSVKII